MTAEQPAAADQAAPPRPIRRRASDRVVGGVAGGIADYLNVDPVLIRVAFVGLMVFGGAGLVLYVASWLLIPLEGREHSVVDAFLRRLALSPRGVVTLGLLAVAVLLAVQVANGGGGGISLVAVLLILGIILLQVLGLLRNIWVTGITLVVGGLILLSLPVGGDLGLGGVYVTNGVAILFVFVAVGLALLLRGGGEPVTVAAPLVAEAAPAVVKRRPKAPASPLGWYVLAAALIAIGLMAIADQALGVRSAPSQFVGMALAAVGIGLVVGSWWGRAQSLILPALVVVPLGVASLFLSAPLEGGIGDHRFAPATTEELRDTYRLLGGGLTLDLRELDTRGQPVEITASVAMGNLLVLLPTEARVDIRSEVGYGSSELYRNTQYGSGLTNRYVRGTRGPHFVLDLEAGIGGVLAFAPGED